MAKFNENIGKDGKGLENMGKDWKIWEKMGNILENIQMFPPLLAVTVICC